uniref:NADH-ubiquinone oxidoreductase chain 4 n=2 Tax=Limnephilus decipiens TaxID=329909 RepID=A0A1D5AVE0_9NEOP|nr:NADH dehydrogenase subunit 4 [Limnephilus decipiens]BAQ19275.1 NADH dehydrogenase subunit 4 [Limnephilus decipiens]
MMKFVFMSLSVVILCFMKNMFWMVQYMIYFLMGLFMLMPIKGYLIFNLSYIFSCDMISYFLILLSIWISGLMILASFKINLKNFHLSLFIFNISFLLLMLICTFSTLNLFMFYLFFEGSLIPVLLLILGWGAQPERIQAGFYLLFYTMVVSLPLLMGIFFIYGEVGSLMIYMINLGNLNLNSMFMYVVMLGAFLVKIPMFLVHLWLPKAHLEAPISGSMILAGIMLKLGGYGIIRVLKIISYLNMSFNSYLIMLSMMGGLLVSLMCFFQMDMKALVAYSSVVHMGLMLAGLMTQTCWGVSGAYLVMIGHGLCSSGLFCLVNLNYERLFSRNLILNKGMLSMMPSLSLWWFMFLSSNMAAPLSLNLLGEVMLISSLVSWSFSLMLLLGLVSFFSAGYSLYLFAFVQQGVSVMNLNNYYLVESREFLLLFLHWVPLNLLFLSVDYMLY